MIYKMACRQLGGHMRRRRRGSILLWLGVILLAISVSSATRAVAASFWELCMLSGKTNSGDYVFMSSGTKENPTCKCPEGYRKSYVRTVKVSRQHRRAEYRCVIRAARRVR